VYILVTPVILGCIGALDGFAGCEQIGTLRGHGRERTVFRQPRGFSVLGRRRLRGSVRLRLKFRVENG